MGASTALTTSEQRPVFCRTLKGLQPDIHTFHTRSSLLSDHPAEGYDVRANHTLTRLSFVDSEIVATSRVCDGRRLPSFPHEGQEASGRPSRGEQDLDQASRGAPPVTVTS
jgi:hypothetical protein